VLAFAAEQRLVEAAQVGALLQTSTGAAARRLRALASVGLLESDRRLAEKPTWYRIRPPGLRLIESTLPSPRRADLDTHHHDVGLGWLWIAARQGAFGRLRGVVSERRMRSHDGTADGGLDPFGMRLPGAGPRGRERLHYPDLLLETSTGHRIALELELTSKNRARREEILRGYMFSKLEAVIYLVEKPAVGKAISSSARRLGISDLVHVQRISFADPGTGRAAGRAAERAPRQAERPRPSREPGR
jgi:hypothetical protein